jgi:hypothetical protein
MSEKLSERFAAIQHDNFDCLDDLLPTTEIPSRNQFLALAALTTKLAGLVERALAEEGEAQDDEPPQAVTEQPCPFTRGDHVKAKLRTSDFHGHVFSTKWLVGSRLWEIGVKGDGECTGSTLYLSEHSLELYTEPEPPCPFKPRDRVRNVVSGKIGIVAGRHQDPHLLAVHYGDPWAQHWLVSECELAPALVWTEPPNTKGLLVTECGRYRIERTNLVCEENSYHWAHSTDGKWASKYHLGSLESIKRACQQHADAKERAT